MIFFGSRSILFKTNRLVKSFIISEVFLWSSWNFVIPIFAVFVAEQLPGGNLEIAATAFSFHLIVRIIFEIISGRLTSKLEDIKKFSWMIAGLLLISLSFIGFVFSNNVLSVFISYGILGLGLGISSPAKYSTFSKHLDTNKESAEWGLYDAVTFSGMAVSAGVSGYIAVHFGFKLLFLIAAITSLIAIIPYLFYLRRGVDKITF